MPIKAPCECGKILTVQDKAAGKTVRCPHCQAGVPVPAAPEDDFKIIEESPPQAPPAAPSLRPDELVRVALDQPEVIARREPSEEAPRLTRLLKGTQFFVAEGAPTNPGWLRIQTITQKTGYIPDSTHTRAAPMPSDDDDDDHDAFAPERRGISAGMVGGIIMMVIAVVWFVLGWMAGIIFIYPPILFVIGLFAFFKGLFTGNVAGGR